MAADGGARTHDGAGERAARARARSSPRAPASRALRARRATPTNAAAAAPTTARSTAYEASRSRLVTSATSAASARSERKQPRAHLREGSPRRRTVLPGYARPNPGERRPMPDTTLTWLGHAAFRLDTAGGKRVYVDPFLNGNPKCPEDEQTPERVDVDRAHPRPRRPCRRHGRAREEARLRRRRARRARGLARQAGRRRGEAQQPEQGRHGRASTASGSRSRTHSTRAPRPTARMPASPPGSSSRPRTARRIYFAGDTCVFGDMQLIGRIYEPDLAVLPIGDHFTMGPKEAAVAVELLGVKRVVPCHWGTFDASARDARAAAGARPERASRSRACSPATR